MSDDTREIIAVRTQHDIARVRRALSGLLSRAAAKPTETTKFVTAASELARNTLIHGGGGTVTVELERERRGFRVCAVFEDLGPGIADTVAALCDGYTTGAGLGLGLGGAKRLCETFEIETSPGQGTRIRITSGVGR